MKILQNQRLKLTIHCSLKPQISLKLKEIFQDRLYIEINRHGLDHESEFLPFAMEMSEKHSIELVAANDTRYTENDDLDLEQQESQELIDPIKNSNFEVLVIDKLTEHEDILLKNSYKSLRDKSDRFTYDILVQPSFQDALIALLFNYNIQAVVIRFAPSFHSDRIKSGIEDYIRNIYKYDYSIFSRDLLFMLNICNY